MEIQNSDEMGKANSDNGSVEASTATSNCASDDSVCGQPSHLIGHVESSLSDNFCASEVHREMFKGESHGAEGDDRKGKKRPANMPSSETEHSKKQQKIRHVYGEKRDCLANKGKSGKIASKNDEGISGLGEKIAHADHGRNIQNSAIMKTEDGKQVWKTVEEATAMVTGDPTCIRNVPTTKTENDGTLRNAAKAYPFMNRAFVTYDGRAVFQHNNVLLEQPMRHIGEESCAISHFPMVPVINQCTNGMRVRQEPMLPIITSRPCGERTGQHEAVMGRRVDDGRPVTWSSYDGIPRNTVSGSCQLQGHWRVRNDAVPQGGLYSTLSGIEADDGQRFITIKVPADSDIEITVKPNRR